MSLFMLIYHLDANTTFFKDRPESKIYREMYDPDYCKGNICVCIHGDSNKPFIEFPDIKGYIHKYSYAHRYKTVVE